MDVSRIMGFPSVVMCIGEVGGCGWWRLDEVAIGV